MKPSRSAFKDFFLSALNVQIAFYLLIYLFILDFRNLLLTLFLVPCEVPAHPPPFQPDVGVRSQITRLSEDHRNLLETEPQDLFPYTGTFSSARFLPVQHQGFRWCSSFSAFGGAAKGPSHLAFFLLGWLGTRSLSPDPRREWKSPFLPL